MARSKIIQDMANESVEVSTALKRAKVLLSDLKNKELLDWVNHELSGYPENAVLPDYRKTTGNIIGSYIVGSMSTHMKCENVQLPLGKMPEEMKHELLSFSFHEGVDALKSLLNATNTSNRIEKSIPADCYPVIVKYNNNPFMTIITAKVVLGSQSIHNILSEIESRLLDIFLLLEKEFGILDELDINAETKGQKELDEIIEKLIIIVFNDNSVTIGDKNTIKESTIASKVHKD